MNDDIHIFEAFVTNDEVNLEYRNYYNESFLHLAARHNSVKIIEYLLAWGLDPNVRNVYNNTPAFMALFEEKYEALQLLIEKGADLTIKNDDGVTVTEIAIIQDKVDVLRYILEQRQRKHNGIVYDPYILAIQHQALNVLNYLMSINYPTKERIEVIFFSACQNGQIEIIELLLKHGLSVNTYYKKRTPLFWAVAGRQLEATKYLLDQGADPNPKGYSPLALAAAEGNIDLVKLLVDYGANPHYQNRKQLTALMMAVYYGRLEVVQYLVELGVDVRKLTPLAVAAEAGQYEIAEYLLQKGTTIVPKTHSPVKMAIRFGQHQILELLFNHGFSLDKRDMKFSDLNMMMAQSKKRKNNFLDQALSNALEDKNNIRVCDFVLNVFKRYQRELVITALLFLALIIFILSITFNTYKTYRHFSIESEKIFAHITSINNNNREVTYTYTIDSNVIHSKSEVSEGVLNELQLNEYVEILYKTNNVHDSILVKQHSTNQSGFIAGLVVAGIFMLIDLVYFIWIRKERKYVNQLYNRQTDQHQVQ